MGAKSEDTDPTPLKGGTEPGLGPKRPNGAPASPAGASAKKEDPAPVDFDALNAALGDLPHPKGSIPPKAASESEGRSSATYSSARPHTIPPAHEPSDLDAPPVIVAGDVQDTVPAAPPKMTTPLAPGVVPAAVAPGSGNHRVPSSGNQPVAAKSQQPSYPFTPQPFPVQRGVVQPTMKMPDRPRRPRSPTVVVRPRGPSKVQKLVVFAAMLVLFLAFALAVAIWRQPGWFGLDTQAPTATPSTHLPSYSAAVASISAAPTAPTPPTVSAPPTASTTPAPSASASAKPGFKKPPFGK